MEHVRYFVTLCACIIVFFAFAGCEQEPQPITARNMSATPDSNCECHGSKRSYDKK